jgi:hypothetical protein
MEGIDKARKDIAITRPKTLFIMISLLVDTPKLFDKLIYAAPAGLG